MLTIKVDPHTHTIFSGHAFGTIEENIRHAAEQGMEAIAMTEHFSPLFTQLSNGFPQLGGALNMDALPNVCMGVRVLAGVEIDIVDTQGHFAFWDLKLPFPPPKKKKSEGGDDGKPRPSSLPEFFLSTREFSIASVHMRPGQIEGDDFTDMYVRVIENPLIHAIGHPIRAGLPFDQDAFLDACKAYGKLPEVNEHTFDFSDEAAKKVEAFAEKCAEKGVRIIVGSDAHSSFMVGKFEKALGMLEAIHFPQELIANTTLATFETAISDRKK